MTFLLVFNHAFNNLYSALCSIGNCAFISFCRHECTYGHPYGATGAILAIHLLRSLQTAGGGLGILSIAGAGGMGEAVLLHM